MKELHDQADVPLTFTGVEHIAEVRGMEERKSSI